MSVLDGFVAYEFLRCRKLLSGQMTTTDIAKIRTEATAFKYEFCEWIL